MLSWDPGVFAVTHDVYLGTSREDVDSADMANPLGAMLSQGQTGNHVDAGRLTFDQTYYWRVDEVNGAPDRTVYKGDIWSFTVEPRAIEIENLTVTASGANPDMGPEKTIDGSGLNELEQHSARPEAMWLTLTNGSWIQYEFDRTYKLHEMWVWNSNQVVEAFIGFGVKEVAIETSVDGETWTPFNGITELARASGQPTYTANTTVALGGVMAKYVKLSVQSAHGITGQSGLAEVRFTAIPVFPRAPHPADGTSATGVDVQMRWRSGREAVSHDVAFGPDPDAVAQGTAPVNTVSDSRYDAGILDFGTQYFWQVAEVNDAATPSVHAGDIWSFTTPEYDIFEDIESYSGEEGQEIYMTWWDGYGGDDVLGGSTTGYIDAPFVETSIVNPGMGGSQSMPMFFDNSGGFINIDGITSAPTYSEVLRELDGLDFTTGNAQVLALSFRGHAVGFAEDTDGSISMSAAGSDIWGTADQFRFAYITLTGDGAITAKVRSLTTVHDWSKAGIMIRETLAPDSSFATMVATGINGVTFQQRLLAGGSATSDSNTRDTAQADQDDEPVWLRLERTGTNFNAYWSLDGVTWNPSVANPQTIPMNSPTIYIGLGVTSHSPGNPATAVFSDLSFTGNVTGAWTAEVIGDEAMPSNDGRDPLYITVEDSTGKSVTVIHPDPTAIQTGTWQDWLIPMTEFDSLRKSGVKAIGIGVGYRDGSQTGTEGILYIDDIRLGTPITTE